MRKGNSFNQPSTEWPMHPKWGRTVPNASKLPTAAEESGKKDAPSRSGGNLKDAFRIRFDLVSTLLNVSCEDFE